MTDTSEPSGAAPAPILVAESPKRTQIDTSIGQLVPALGGVVLAFGLMSPTKEAALAGLLPIVLSYGWRVWSATHTHSALVAAADAAPDDVAQVVRK